MFGPSYAGAAALGYVRRAAWVGLGLLIALVLLAKMLGAPCV